MAVLNLRNVPDELAQALKVEAATKRMGVRDYCVDILQKRNRAEDTSKLSAEFDSVAPNPGFDMNVYFSPAENDFPVVGFVESSVLNKDVPLTGADSGFREEDGKENK